jgi:hypothetical protein
MAFKESNPITVQLVLLSVSLSILVLCQALFLTMSLNLTVILFTESVLTALGLMASGYGLVLILPKAYLFSLVAFGVTLYKRHVYGPKHARSALIGFFLFVLGTTTPIFLFLMTMIFEKGYLSFPLFLNLIFLSVILAFYYYVKDIGGERFGLVALIIYSLGALILVNVETSALYLGTEDLLEDGIGKVLAVSSLPGAALCLTGAAVMLVAYIKAFKWVKEHKPLIDEQQGKQLKMQAQSLVMQQEQLELQKEQVRMLKENFEMLTRLQNDLIASGAIQLPERSSANGGGSDEGVWDPPARKASRGGGPR